MLLLSAGRVAEYLAFFLIVFAYNVESDSVNFSRVSSAGISICVESYLRGLARLGSGSRARRREGVPAAGEAMKLLLLLVLLVIKFPRLSHHELARFCSSVVCIPTSPRTTSG